MLIRACAILLMTLTGLSPLCAQNDGSPAPMGPGPHHWVAFQPGDPMLGRALEQHALVHLEDYVSFAIGIVDEQAFGGRDAFANAGFDVRDNMRLIGFGGAPIDTSSLETVAASMATLPEHLRMSERAVLSADSSRGLFIVQFAGPIRDEWLEKLARSGAEVVSYMPENAYIVTVEGAAHGLFAAYCSESYVRWHGVLQPALKLDPALRAKAGSGEMIDVVVQVIADERAAATITRIAAEAREMKRQPSVVLNFLNIHATLPATLIAEFARDPWVFAIEQEIPLQMFDEAQGQIMAGNITGNAPSGVGYLAWLASKGFAQAGQFAFAVDVTDDGLDRGSMTDVPAEFRELGAAAGVIRFAYHNNYTTDALGDGGGGHGHLNASIIGGYNGLTGTASEDANGYNYGLGIAPFVRVGNSKVFANAGSWSSSASTTTRLSNAYNGGARFSSNSWGQTTGNTYTTDAQAHDTAVRDATTTALNQELSIIFAAGNSGSGANTVRPPATAKNIICVGASENVRQTGTDGCAIANTGADSLNDIISFSSRGPCSDGRKKPDLVAPGTHVQAAASRSAVYNGAGVCNQYWPAGQTLYAWSSGTSHSCPATAGAAALVRQYFINSGFGTPSPAMVKAVLMASTRYMSGTGAGGNLWSTSQGMGLVDLGRAFNGSSAIRVDQTTVFGATGATYTASGNISSGTVPLRVALVWTDKAGATTGNAWVNNLDLEVTVNGTLYRGNVFTGANSVTGGVADAANNAEFVFLPAGTSGAISVVVRATNIAGDGVPGNADVTDQDFALIVQNATAGAPVPNFSLAATPTSQSITAGASTSYTISNTPSGGFTSAITLATSPAITGVTFSFGTNPMAASGTSVLTATTTSAATVGTHLVTVTGTSGTLVRTTTVTLVISAPVVPNFTLAATPTTRTVTPGTATTYSISNAATGGFTSAITLSASPAIAGVTYAFAPNPVAAGGTSVLTVSTGATTLVGTYAITVTGVGGTLTKTVGITLVVSSPLPAGIKTWSRTPNLTIPDNNATGITSTVAVAAADSMTVTSVSVSVNVQHTAKGDLTISLIAPNGTARILHNKTDGTTDHVNTTFSIAVAANQALTTFNTYNSVGTWTLKVTDTIAANTGTLVSWSMTFAGEKAISPALAIPDNNTTGVSSVLAYTGSGTVASVRVRVTVVHTYKGDLEIALIAPDGTTVLLHNLTGGSTDNVSTEFPDLTASAQSLAAFTGKTIAGNWTLRVRDLAAIDTGTLSNWTLSLGTTPTP